MIRHKHKWVNDDGEVICEICGVIRAEMIFDENRLQETWERYGFHCWYEDNPSQANAIKILEDIR